MNNTDWKTIYYRYRALFRGWKILNAPEHEKRFFDMIISSEEPGYFLNHIERKGFREPTLEQWQELLFLRNYIRSLPTTICSGVVFDNVYQLALQIEVDDRWSNNQGRKKIYRGQKNSSWSVIPKLFRGNIFDATNSNSLENSIQYKLDRITRYVRLLQKNGFSVSDEEGVAIIQHYSSEIRTGTWLIDFTWDPFVALFFASDNGDANEVGQISYIDKNEWNRLSANGDNRLGKIRIIEPKGVPRIKAQQALFLDTSHPELFSQYIPYTLRFRQTPGLVFEDILRNPPVAKDILYPRNDLYRDMLLNAEPSTTEKSLDCYPKTDATQQLTINDYLEITNCWLKRDGVELDINKMNLLHKVCTVFNTMQNPEYDYKIKKDNLSLLRLEEAYRQVIYKNANDIDSSFFFLLNRYMDELSFSTISSILKLVNESGKSKNSS